MQLLKKKTYKESKIFSIGPKGGLLYYYGLSSIAIDFGKAFKNAKEMETGWTKVPQNLTEVKLKIIHSILSVRKLS